MEKHIILGHGRQPHQQNLDFFVKLYNCDHLIDIYRRDFYKSSDYCAGKEMDENTNLEQFIDLVNPKFHFILQINWFNDGEIRYLVKGSDDNLKSRLCWITCSYCQRNYQTIDSIFRDCYGESIREAQITGY